MSVPVSVCVYVYACVCDLFSCGTVYASGPIFQCMETYSRQGGTVPRGEITPTNLVDCINNNQVHFIHFVHA